MDLVATILTKYGKSYGKAILASITKSYDLINTIKTEMSKLSREISEAHFEFALQSIAASKNSKNPKVELATCVGHLRDAFNIAKAQRYAKKRESTLFGLSSKEVDLLNKSQKIMLNIYLSIICRKISEVYRYLGENVNSSQWDNERKSIQAELVSMLDIESDNIRSSEYFAAKRSYDDTYKEIGIFVLMGKIDGNYVTSKGFKENYISPSGAGYEIPCLRLSLSSEGKEFIKNITS